jgi:hypothetical protein
MTERYCRNVLLVNGSDEKFLGGGGKLPRFAPKKSTLIDKGVRILPLL